MGSTNKTANLGLSQFIGTDKPTWLVDYNNDMAVIDEAIGELQNDSGLTDTAIAELQTNVQNLQSGQGDSATEIAEIKSDVQTLSANYETMHHEVAVLEDKQTALEEKQNDYLPLTGGIVKGTLTNQNTGGVSINSYNITKGETPNAMRFLQIRLQDSKNTAVNADCLSRWVYTVKTDGSNVSELINCKNEAGSEEIAKLQIGFNSNGEAYATAPTPANANAKNSEIATTAWVWNLLASLGLITNTTEANE